MSAEEVAAYLDARSEWAVLTTLQPDGYPHSVTLGYFRLGEDVYLGMKEGTQKVRNVEWEARASVLVTSAKVGGAIAGVLLQGEASIVRDRGERLRLARAAARARGDAEAALPGRVSEDGVYLRLAPRRTVSWTYD